MTTERVRERNANLFRNQRDQLVRYTRLRHLVREWQNKLRGIQIPKMPRACARATILHDKVMGSRSVLTIASPCLGVSARLGERVGARPVNDLRVVMVWIRSDNKLELSELPRVATDEQFHFLLLVFQMPKDLA